MIEQTQSIPTQADIYEVRDGLLAANIKSNTLEELLIKEQAEAHASEVELEKADQAARDCLRKSLAAQKKVNGTLIEAIAVMSEISELSKKERFMKAQIDGSSTT